MNQAYVYDAVRTPFGKFGSGLAGVRPDDLAAHVVREAVNRAPALDVERIDEVVFGNANGAGEENRNVARMATLARNPVDSPQGKARMECGAENQPPHRDHLLGSNRQIRCKDRASARSAVRAGRRFDDRARLMDCPARPPLAIQTDNRKVNA